MSDLIERDKAINILDVIDVDIIPYADTRECVMIAIDHIRKELEELPSARPKGEWKPFDQSWGREIWYCTACETSMHMPTRMGKPMYEYCPNCGSDNREREGE